jgi:hypothetical protein
MSLNQSKPNLLESFNIRDKSILSWMTASHPAPPPGLCYEALVRLGNHVDGLIWVRAGG